MPNVYTTGGQATFETGRDAIVSLIDELKQSMLGAGDYNPAISFVYERHNVADLRLNAVSVSLASMESVVPNTSLPNTQSIFSMILNYSVRVHTAYDDGVRDDQKAQRLIDSIINKLATNKHALPSGFYLNQFTSADLGQRFEESGTIGGELIVTLQSNFCYTLEA